jgi:hypothetical protein
VTGLLDDLIPGFGRARRCDLKVTPGFLVTLSAGHVVWRIFGFSNRRPSYLQNSKQYCFRGGGKSGRRQECAATIMNNCPLSGRIVSYAALVRRPSDGQDVQFGRCKAVEKQNWLPTPYKLPPNAWSASARQTTILLAENDCRRISFSADPRRPPRPGVV